VWDADSSIKSTPMDFPQGLLLDAQFRAGFARLSRYGLSFDAFLYHTQIPELADLARTFPDTTIVLNHGVYAGRRDEVFKDWQRSIRDLGKCPNVRVKLGGMGMHFFGFGFEKLAVPASSEELAKAWRPFVETCVEAFGPPRAMFESNFPVDKRYYSYGVMWNAFKRLAAGYSSEEKAELFLNAARRTYRLPISA
jgi:L-fuconolactonase